MRKITATAIIACVGYACGSTERFLRPEPAFHINSGQQISLTLPDDIKDSVALRCVGNRQVSYTDGLPKPDQCLYISADITKIPALLDKFSKESNRDTVARLLISVSDQNCTTFLARAFANKAGIDTTNGILSDLATGGAAGTAAANPAISAGLNVGNLLFGKTTGNFDKTYYAEKTFQAMESAILGERAETKALIVTNLRTKKTSQYTIFDVLGEIKQYDESCSIQHGLLKLASVADENRKAGEAALKTALEGPKPEK